MNLRNKNNLKTSFFTSAISLVLLSVNSPGVAKTIQEQCAGVVKAGMNDCRSSEHACVGLNGDDGYESDWLWLPVGTCNKIAGAHVIPPNKDKKI